MGFDPVVASLERALAGTVDPSLETTEKIPAMEKKALPEAPPKETPRPWWTAWPPWAFAAAAPAVLLFVVGLYFMFRPHPHPTQEKTASKTGELAKKRAPEPELAATVSTATGDMVLVPVGPFQHGEDRQRAELPAFYIDKTEVTNAAYAAFCAATSRPLRADFPQDRPDDPVGNVTIADAHAFATWAGKRLPNALEWEKAARGDDGRAFPWGNTPDITRANVGSRKLLPANAFRQGKAPMARCRW
jgi:formylglycine-generating enzyme required for sulfatase activity